MYTGVLKKATRPKHTQQTSSSQSRLFHARSQQNLHEKTTIDQFKLQQQFIKEIQLAKQAIQNYSNQLQLRIIPKTPPLRNTQCIKILNQMQKLIEARNIQIQNINQQIKIWKNTTQQVTNEMNKKYKTVKNVQLYKLTDQIIQQKEQLIALQRQHQRKKLELDSNRKIMKQTVEACLNGQATGSRYVISYNQFISRKKQKRQQDSNQKSRRLTRKNMINLRQAIDNQQQKRNILNSNNLKQVQNKKRVAELALKGIKKRHQADVNQLLNKLQFLQDENQQFDIKLKKKVDQLKSAELRFSQTKQQNTQNTQNAQNAQNMQNSQTKKTLKQARYSEPQL